MQDLIGEISKRIRREKILTCTLGYNMLYPGTAHLLVHLAEGGKFASVYKLWSLQYANSIGHLGDESESKLHLGSD